MTTAQVAALSTGTEYSRLVGADLPLDRWIAYAVKVLDGGIETYESCEGGSGHASMEAMVRFHGGAGEGHRALGIALGVGLPAYTVRRFWTVLDGEPHGPHWEITFRREELRRVTRAAESAGLIR